MGKVVAKTEDEMIAAIEAQTKERRHKDKVQRLSTMYGKHADSVMFPGFSADLCKPVEAIKLSPPKPKFGYASITPDTYKKVLEMTMSMLAKNPLTITYIQSYIESAAPEILPVMVRDAPVLTVPRVIIATHKPVPDDIKRHFDGLRAVGTIIDYQQLAIVPWPDPAAAKSPIPPKTTTAPAAAPAAPATKVFPTNALKHSWTKPGGVR